MTDKQPEALIRADELETIGAESSLARAMAAHTIRLLYKENEALRARLAQPEPQPVAWVAYENGEKHGIDFDEDEIAELPVGTMLYTAPPQREWQGLTEVERIDIIDEEITAQSTEHFALAQAIEAKLKEKNT